jgi:hypothetical protein
MNRSKHYSAREVVDLASQQIRGLEEELKRLEGARREHASDLQKVDHEIAAAWQYLGTVLVPDLEPAHLQWASQLLSLPKLEANAVQQRMQADRASLHAKISEIEGDDAYVRREGRLNECAIQMEELQASIEPLRLSLSELDAQPLWVELLAFQYGTDSYPHKWWQLSYYRHWKHADMALAALGERHGAKTFAELRTKYYEEKAAYDQLVATHADYAQRKTQIDGLVEEHARVQQRIADLPTRHLTQARSLVVEHLRPIEPEVVADMLTSYPPGVVGFKRVLGLMAKRAYLERTFTTWVAAPRPGIVKALRKAKRDVVKLTRPKNRHRTFPPADVERRFADRRPKWHARQNRYRESRTTLLAFQDYDAWSFDDDRPWWSVMTGDRVKARFIPELERYYDRQQHQRRTKDDDDDLAVAALASEAAIGPDDDGDMS